MDDGGASDDEQDHPQQQQQQNLVGNGHHHLQAPPPQPDGRVLYVAWSRLHVHKTISIPPGTTIYPHELKETLYAALLKHDGRSIICREEFNKHLFVGLYYLHKGESRLIPLSVLVQRLDYFSGKRLYLIDPDMVAHDWSISFVRSAVLTLLVLLLLLIFAKGPATGTIIFLLIVCALLAAGVGAYLVFTLLLPEPVQLCLEAVLHSVVVETLLSSSAAQLLLILIVAGLAYGLPQSQHLAQATTDRAAELAEHAREALESLKAKAFVALVKADNWSEAVFAFLYQHGWLGLPLELSRQDERQSYTHLCSKLFSNGVSFWDDNYPMCETLLRKRVRASALQMKKACLLFALCGGFIFILNRLTYVPAAERRSFSWVTLIEWALVLGFALMTYMIPFDSFDLFPGIGSF